jgi:hypothetical protein
LSSGEWLSKCFDYSCRGNPADGHEISILGAVRPTYGFVPSSGPWGRGRELATCGCFEIRIFFEALCMIIHDTAPSPGRNHHHHTVFYYKMNRPKETTQTTIGLYMNRFRRHL